MIWGGILVASVACYLLKLAGLSVPSSVMERPRIRQAAALLPVALIAALIAEQTVSTSRSLVLDARMPAVLVAVVAVWRRVPFLVVVVLAAATAAGIRAIS